MAFKAADKLTNYVLAKVSLIRAACPPELENRPQNQSLYPAIIIEANKEKLGALNAMSYLPRAVIVAGNARKKFLLKNGVVSSWAWVQKGALEINADDAMSCQELIERLNALLKEKLYGPNREPGTGQPWPSIFETYPFENYFIYSLGGIKYRQHYVIDPVERKCRLNGGSIEVKEMFVDAAIAETMPRVQTGVRYSAAPMQGNLQSVSRGAPHSELFTEVIRNWANIAEAARMYVDATKHGLYKPMRPAFHPVEIMPNGHLSGALAAMGIDIADFVRWSAEAQHQKFKTKGGTKIPRSKFAYAPTNDPSTWKLPIDTPGRTRNAAARINQVKGVPAAKKAAILKRVRNAEKKIGVSVPTKPTDKQKHWTHRKAS